METDLKPELIPVQSSRKLAPTGWPILVAWMAVVFVLSNFFLPGLLPGSLFAYVVRPVLWLSMGVLALLLYRRMGKIAFSENSCEARLAETQGPAAERRHAGRHAGSGGHAAGAAAGLWQFPLCPYAGDDCPQPMVRLQRVVRHRNRPLVPGQGYRAQAPRAGVLIGLAAAAGTADPGGEIQPLCQSRQCIRNGGPDFAARSRGIDAGYLAGHPGRTAGIHRLPGCDGVVRVALADPARSAPAGSRFCRRDRSGVWAGDPQ